MLCLGNRICLIDSDSVQYLGTIRFYGTIHPWPTSKCLGIEWDDKSRGKNDGSLELDGQTYRYFTTTNGNKSGSFIKLKSLKPIFLGFTFINLSKGRKLVISGRTLVDALNYKYNELANVQNDESIRIGTKVVEKYGFEKLMRMQANFQQLKTVSLDHLLVGSTVGCEYSDLGNKILNSVDQLDLSYNLLDSWEELVQIGNCLPKLRSLKATGNSIRKQFTDDQIVQAPQINRLILGFCKLGSSFDKIMYLIHLNFPKLCELDLSGNGFTSLVSGDPIETSLRSLNFSYNSLSGPVKIDDNLSLLEDLDLSFNHIIIITGSLRSLKSLDLTSNEIQSWDFMDKFDSEFPQLESIKMVNNPVFDDTESKLTYDDCLSQIFSRIKTVHTVNGTRYSEKQRRNYELYFISQVREGKITKPSINVWKRLVNKFGLNDSIQQKKTTSKTGQEIPEIVEILDKASNRLILKQMVFPKTTTVGKLKGKVGRKLNKSVLNFGLYLKNEHGNFDSLDDDQEYLYRIGVNHSVYIE